MNKRTGEICVVSVIVPIFNVEKYLDQCVESIVAQTFQDIEILLIDDGSTDTSPDICRAWAEKDPRVRYIRKENEGLGSTRNRGVQLAHGEVIAFVDADDWIAADFLEVMLHAMGDADIVFCDYYLFRGDKTLTGRRYCVLDTPRAMAECPNLLYTMGGATWNKLYRTDFWRRSGILQPDYAFEDTAVMPLLWGQANLIAQVRRPLYYYRINRPESITNQTSTMQDMVKAVESIVSGFCANGWRKHYGLLLEKYCALAIRIPLSRLINFPKESCEAKELYYQLFPRARKVDQLAFLVLGSSHAEYTLSRVCFLRDEFPRTEWSEQWEEALRCSTAQVILMDFMQGPLPDPVRLATLLQDSQAMICIQNDFLSRGYGLYGLEQTFAEIEWIANRNAQLQEFYKRLHSLLPHAYALSCTENDFTDIEFSLGCMPTLKNQYFYYTVADKLREQLETLI